MHPALILTHLYIYLAWMLEKYHDWTFHPAERQDTEALPCTISSEEFLTQVSIYWITNTMSSSVRIYYECLQQKEMMQVVSPRIKIPVAVCAFAHDISRVRKLDFMQMCIIDLSNLE